MKIEVTGGQAGVSANDEELHAVARALAGDADEAGAVRAVVGRVAVDPDLVVSAAFDPAGAAHVHAELTEALARLTGLCLARRSLATAVRAAAVAYELSELQVQQVLVDCWHLIGPEVAKPLVLAAVAGGVGYEAEQTLRRVVAAAPGALAGVVSGDIEPGQLGSLATGVVTDGLRQDGQDLLGWLVRHPVVAREVLATLPMLTQGLAPADPQGVTTGAGAAGFTALLLAAGRRGGLFTQGRVEITGQTTGVRPAAVGPSDLASRLSRQTDPRGALTGYQPMQGGVVVDRLDPTAPGQPRRWIVYLPPTNDWGVRGGKYPTDLTSNLELVAKQGMRGGLPAPDAVEEGKLAIRTAGIKPGEPVMLVGFSQGGITAAHLAADPQLRHQVKGVLTAGAPISEFDLPASTQVLSLENQTDPVPLLDGSANPDRRNWTTVTGQVTGPDGNPLVRDRTGAEPFSGHYLDGYLELAAQAEESRDPSLQHWKSSMAEFFPAGSSVTTTEYSTRRVPS